jgi:hypothetical protein
VQFGIAASNLPEAFSSVFLRLIEQVLNSAVTQFASAGSGLKRASSALKSMRNYTTEHG